VGQHLDIPGRGNGPVLRTPLVLRGLAVWTPHHHITDVNDPWSRLFTDFVAIKINLGSINVCIQTHGNAVRPRPMVKLKNEKQSLTPSAHAHEAPKALTPRSAHCSANGYELRIKGSRLVAKRGGMAIVSLSFQRI